MRCNDSMHGGLGKISCVSAACVAHHYGKLGRLSRIASVFTACVLQYYDKHDGQGRIAGVSAACVVRHYAKANMAHKAESPVSPLPVSRVTIPGLPSLLSPLQTAAVTRRTARTRAAAKGAGTCSDTET